MMPEFLNTFTAGALVQTVILIGGMMGGFYALKTDISVIKNNVLHLQEAQKTLTEAFSQLGKVLTAVAVQDNRINMIEKRVDDLAHGKGHIR